MSSVLLFFIDGLGIGTRGSHNPLDRLRDDASPLAIFTGEEPELPDGGMFARTDACLSVAGRPQSASGQTTILTGVNAPKALGYHKQGFPNEDLRRIILEHSIFLQLKAAGVFPNIFANAYTSRFFAARPRWVSTTTLAVEAANLRLCNIEDLREGRALFHDFTNELLSESGDDIDRRTPEEAARILAGIAGSHRFTLYEYFLTDKVGHLQDMSKALVVLADLARLLRTLLKCLNLRETTLIVTSDHGNIENLDIRNHTLNPVPTLAWGSDRETVAQRVKSLADITPTVIDIFTKKASTETLNSSRHGY